MKYWISYISSVLLLGIFVALVAWVFPMSHARYFSYISPLPDFLTLGKNNQVTGLDLWMPIVETFASTTSEPQIGATAVLIYDMENNKILYERNKSKQLPMASLTKIMTAIIALEDPAMPERYRVYEPDIVGEDSMGLETNEVLSKEELLYGLLLNSGNDAAEVFAHNYPGGREAFIQAMNNKAKALGLTDTIFSNPSGLQGDGTQYTTAYDLLVITRYALENFPLFRTIVSTYQYDIPATSTHKEYFLTNETNLLSSYPGVKGVKTGYTPEAGMCLVTYYEKDGVRLLGILLNSPDRRGEMRELLDYSLKTLGQIPPIHD